VTQRTVVHLLRHGEVHNPEKVLYGRLPGYRLSALGEEMAERAATWAKGRDIARVISSPLERARQTAAPVARDLGVEVGIDERIIEAGNKFEGLRVGVGDGALRNPRYWPWLWNPFRPSWGEPYKQLAERMHAAMEDARDDVPGREVLLVSHQLPVWIARLAGEDKRLWHDPRNRECSLASITSFTYEGGRIVGVDYHEPSADLLPRANKTKGA
jgi:broad specificity phosphatase PhoE